MTHFFLCGPYTFLTLLALLCWLEYTVQSGLEVVRVDTLVCA